MLASHKHNRNRNRDNTIQTYFLNTDLYFVRSSLLSRRLGAPILFFSITSNLINIACSRPPSSYFCWKLVLLWLRLVPTASSRHSIFMFTSKIFSLANLEQKSSVLANHRTGTGTSTPHNKPHFLITVLFLVRSSPVQTAPTTSHQSSHRGCCFILHRPLYGCQSCQVLTGAAVIDVGKLLLAYLLASSRSITFLLTSQRSMMSSLGSILLLLFLFTSSSLFPCSSMLSCWLLGTGFRFLL